MTTPTEPAPMQPSITETNASSIDEPARSTLGFARPHPAMTGAVHAALAVRNISRRWHPSVDS